jgi:chromosome segregation ATPase
MCCLKCGQWDHIECTGVDPDKDDYTCPVCDSSQHKDAPGYKKRGVRSPSPLPASSSDFRKSNHKTTQKKRRLRYGEEEEYNPFAESTRGFYDSDEDMKIDIRPKKKSKTSKLIKKEVSGRLDLSQYQRVETVDYKIKKESDDDVYEGRAMRAVKSDNRMKTLFNEIIQGERQLTQFQCERRFEKQLDKKDRELKSKQKEIDSLQKEVDKVQKRYQRVRDTRKDHTIGLADDKIALQRKLQETNEQMEDLYAERDTWKSQELTLTTKIDRLEDEKVDLEKKLKAHLRYNKPKLFDEPKDSLPKIQTTTVSTTTKKSTTNARKKKSLKSKPKVKKKRKLKRKRRYSRKKEIERIQKDKHSLQEKKRKDKRL